MNKLIFILILVILLVQPVLAKEPDFNVIVVGWDGVQRNHLMECYNKELSGCPNGLPNLKELSNNKIFPITVTSGDTSTKPGWTQILTGYNAKVTGVYANNNYQPIPKGYTIFEKLENHFGEDNIVTMFLSGKNIHTGGACKGEKISPRKNIIEKIGQPWCIAKNYLDKYKPRLHENKVVIKKALKQIRRNKDKKIFALVHFWNPDHTSHKYGENSEKYTKKLIDLDKKLGKLMRELKVQGIYDKTFIYVTTDHGFDEGTKHHANAPYTFLASNDPEIIRGGDRKDLAPTLLEKYGLSLDDGKTPKIDGQSLYSYPSLNCIPEGQAFLDYPNAPQCCSRLTLIGLDKFIKKFNCLAPTGGQGDNSGYCTQCGNNICEPQENKCNCPSDCT